MGKRYYCDFCDKTIPNNVDIIKKHNEGSQHHMARNTYYLKYKDLGTILYEEREKKPCAKYFTTGYCKFGDLCHNSHKTKEQVEQLEDLYRLECHKKVKIEEEKQEKNRALRIKTNMEQKEFLTEHLDREEHEFFEIFFPKYHKPKKLSVYDESILPESLRPPNYKDFLNYEPNSWLDYSD